MYSTKHEKRSYKKFIFSYNIEYAFTFEHALLSWESNLYVLNKIDYKHLAINFQNSFYNISIGEKYILPDSVLSKTTDEYSWAGCAGVDF